MQNSENSLKPLLRTTDLTKQFKNSDGSTITACDHVSIDVMPGKTLGIVGESGCGKTTLMKMLVGLLTPDSGSIDFDGTDLLAVKGEQARQMRRDIQLIFQDPGTAFNPRMKIAEIICGPLLNFDLITRKEMAETAAKYLDMVELPREFAGRYPHELSGGQRQRIGLARALTLHPKLIICDEVTSALDVSVQKSMIALLKKFQREDNIAYIFICHDLALVEQVADDIEVMYKGAIVETMVSENIREKSEHPYTRVLIDSVFEPGMRRSGPVRTGAGEETDKISDPRGCSFYDRCPEALPVCGEEKPHLQPVSEHHQLACRLGSK
ncbi:MAG: ABC transporter ATP-binding protein [Eubacteriaceae bacterium]